MLATVAAADSAKVQKKNTAFLFIAKRKPHAIMCALYKQTRKFCVLQYFLVLQIFPYLYTPDANGLNQFTAASSNA